MPLSKNTPPRECVVCAKSFVPRSKAQVACSQACGHVAKRKNGNKQCPACLADFTPKYRAQIYCGFTCSSTAKRIDRTVECAKCGAKFERPHGKVRTYCSRRCAADVTNMGKARPSGATRLTSAGYVMLKVGRSWRQEHRVVMEQILNRPLQPMEYVHHRNGNRADNRPENLELWAAKRGSKKDPPGQRVSDLVEQVVANPLLASLTEKQLFNLRLALAQALQ